MDKKYAVQWAYRSNLGGPWVEGDVVNLGEENAEAINRDSPGVLIEAVKKGKTPQKDRAIKTAVKDRTAKVDARKKRKAKAEAEDPKHGVMTKADAP